MAVDVKSEKLFDLVDRDARVEKLGTGFTFTEGPIWNKKGRFLLFSDMPADIRVFDRQPDGTIANGRMFFDNIGSGVIEEGIPDGMKCDERGNVYVTGPSGVWVISPEAEHLGVIEVPENVGNLNWGGDDWRDLYMPSSTSLYRIRIK